MRAGLGVGYVSALGTVHVDATLVAIRVDMPRGLRRDLTAFVPDAESCPRSARLFMNLGVELNTDPCP